MYVRGIPLTLHSVKGCCVVLLGGCFAFFVHQSINFPLKEKVSDCVMVKVNSGTKTVTNMTILISMQASQAMSTDFVKVNAMATVKESLGAMLARGERCALVVDDDDLLEGIISSSDLQREVLRATEESAFSDAPITVEVCMLTSLTNSSSSLSFLLNIF